MSGDSGHPYCDARILVNAEYTKEAKQSERKSTVVKNKRFLRKPKYIPFHFIWGGGAGAACDDKIYGWTGGGRVIFLRWTHGAAGGGRIALLLRDGNGTPTTLEAWENPDPFAVENAWPIICKRNTINTSKHSYWNLNEVQLMINTSGKRGSNEILT